MRALVPFLGAIAFGLVWISVLTGSAPLSLQDAMVALAGQGPEGPRLIIWEIRLPRALAAFGTGAALGLAGAALQGLLQNPLAEPGVLGVSAFASLGAVIAIYFGLAAAGSFAVPVAAIIGAGVAVGLLLLVAGSRAGTVTLILTGIGLSSFAGALMALALNLAPNPASLADLVNWMLGTVANRSWADLAYAAPAWLLGAAAIVAAGPGLRALTLGEDAAASVGANPQHVRLLVVAGTSLLAGASVAIAGTIGFVGIIAPHLVRPLAGNDPQRILLPAALLGGIILAAADLTIRLLPVQTELKLGVAAALIGAPLFIWIAARRERGMA